jgi:hypothetical protein
VNEILLYCALGAGLLPLGIYYIFKRKAKETERPVIPFLWLIAFASAYELFGTLHMGWSSAVWFSIYDLLEFCALWYYLNRMLKGHFHKSLYIFVLFFVIAYVYMNWNAVSGLRGKAVLSSITFPFVFVCSFIWLNGRLQKTGSLVLATPLPQWLIVLALLSFYTLTYFLYLLGYSLYESDHTGFFYFWQINVILTLAFRLTLSIAVWKMERK